MRTFSANVDVDKPVISPKIVKSISSLKEIKASREMQTTSAKNTKTLTAEVGRSGGGGGIGYGQPAVREESTEAATSISCRFRRTMGTSRLHHRVHRHHRRELVWECWRSCAPTIEWRAFNFHSVLITFRR